MSAIICWTLLSKTDILMCMRYFLFIPERNTWSNTAYTAEELGALPGIRADSMIIESEGARRILYFSQIQPAVITSPRASAPESARRVTNNPNQKKVNVVSRQTQMPSIDAYALEERLLTYRLVRIVCRLHLFFIILSISASLLVVLFRFLLSTISPSDISTGVGACMVLGGIGGIMISYLIARDLGTKKK